MFRKIPFTESERNVIDSIEGFLGTGTIDVRNTPVTPRANMDALFYDKHPFWIPHFGETKHLSIPLYDAQLSRSSNHDSTDVFGIKWKYVPAAGGSMVEPGAPLMTDANDWRELIKIPDVTAWNWAHEAEQIKIDPRFSCLFSCINGFGFERLISFMDFMYAAMAVIDEDQTDAVKELLSALADLGCAVIDMVCTNLPAVDLIEIHDDWGSQKAPFFSETVARELFVPNMKKMTDRIHSWGRRALLHSCGHNAERVQCFIDAGFDMWSPQAMNDIQYLYDNYGDKIVLGVFPEEEDLATRSEEAQRAAARAFVDRFCQPGKPTFLGIVGVRRTTPAFLDEMYVYSRKHYLEQD